MPELSRPGIPKAQPSILKKWKILHIEYIAHEMARFQGLRAYLQTERQGNLAYRSIKKKITNSKFYYSINTLKMLTLREWTCWLAVEIPREKKHIASHRDYKLRENLDLWYVAYSAWEHGIVFRCMDISESHYGLWQKMVRRLITRSSNEVRNDPAEVLRHL